MYPFKILIYKVYIDKNFNIICITCWKLAWIFSVCCLCCPGCDMLYCFLHVTDDYINGSPFDLYHAHTPKMVLRHICFNNYSMCFFRGGKEYHVTGRIVYILGRILPNCLLFVPPKKKHILYVTYNMFEFIIFPIHPFFYQSESCKWWRSS